MGARNVPFVFVRVSAGPCCHDLDGILAGRRIVDIVNTFVKYLHNLGPILFALGKTYRIDGEDIIDEALGVRARKKLL